jgi:hypothetical protein
MKKYRLSIMLILTIGLLLFSIQPVLAVPPIPSGFYGTAKIDGLNVPAGTIVSARINGTQYASTIVETYLGDTVYSMDVPGDDTESSGVIEGGVEGNTISFYIGAIKVTQTATWHSGINANLNLTGISGSLPAFSLYIPYLCR